MPLKYNVYRYTQGAVARFEHGVAACLAAGSELLCGGHALGGNFVEPTLFRAPPGFDHPPTARELFSPVLHLVRYKVRGLCKSCIQFTQA